MSEALSPDESMAVIEHLHGVIADLRGLSYREQIVIAGYRAGTPVEEIAAQLHIGASTIVQTACRLRSRGVPLAFNFTRLSGPREPPPRFTATGTTPEGCPTTVTADSQAHADSFLAAMEARDG